MTARWIWLLAAFAAQARVERSYCDNANCGFKCTEGAAGTTCAKDEQCKARCEGEGAAPKKQRDKTIVAAPQVAPLSSATLLRLTFKLR